VAALFLEDSRPILANNRAFRLKTRGLPIVRVSASEFVDRSARRLTYDPRNHMKLNDLSGNGFCYGSSYTLEPSLTVGLRPRSQSTRVRPRAVSTPPKLSKILEVHPSAVALISPGLIKAHLETGRENHGY
jgi:hypothetical protein